MRVKNMQLTCSNTELLQRSFEAIDEEIVSHPITPSSTDSRASYGHESPSERNAAWESLREQQSTHASQTSLGPSSASSLSPQETSRQFHASQVSP